MEVYQLVKVVKRVATSDHAGVFAAVFLHCFIQRLTCGYLLWEVMESLPEVVIGGRAVLECLFDVLDLPGSWRLSVPPFVAVPSLDEFDGLDHSEDVLKERGCVQLASKGVHHLENIIRESVDEAWMPTFGKNKSWSSKDFWASFAFDCSHHESQSCRSLRGACRMDA